MKLQIGAILFLIPFILFGSSSKEELHEQLVKQFVNYKGISIQFSNDNFNGKGTILATKGNKYSITFPGRKLLCDGENIWNVDDKKKNVVISIAKQNKNQFSIDAVFFSILVNYKPISLTSGGSLNKSTLLVLQPKNESSMEQGVSKITLELKNNKIIGIIIQSNGQDDYFKIFNIKEKALLVSDYTYQPSNTYTVVDLRK